MKKKIHLIFLLSLMVSPCIQAYDFEADGICYDYIPGTNDVEVTRKGEYNNDYFGDVVIPGTVVYSGVTYNVTRIGDRAFSTSTATSESQRSSYKLISVLLPDGITEIGGRAFSGCTYLTSVTISNGVKYIGFGAFSNCIKLTNITIPNSLTVIEKGIFSGCFELNEILIPDNIQTIERSAFEGCGLTDISIPNSVTLIEGDAFRQCTQAVTLTLGENVKVIESGAFESCIKLTKVSIPAGVTTVGDHAFESCSELKKVTIPNSKIVFGDYIFRSNEALEEIHNLSPVPQSIGSSSFSFVDKTRCTLYVPEGFLNAYKTANVWKDFKNIVEESSVSVPHVNKETISVFPGQDGIWIDCNEYVQVVIFDISGREIYQSEFGGSKEILLEKGIYIVCINGDARKITVQ